MSILRHFGIKDRVVYTLLSFVEITGFFFVSVLAFYGLYRLAVTVGVPVWAWILAGGAYLLIVTIYWAPGEKEDNEAELRAFVLFLVVGLIVGGIWLQAKYHAISATWNTFWGILKSGGR
jgi:hypothetical protein